jgi:hypothetical protein
MIPFTFYWSSGDYYGYGSSLFGLDPAYDAFNYFLGDQITTFSVASYLCLFFALFIHRSVGVKSFLILLSGILHFSMIFTYALLLLDNQYTLTDLLEVIFFKYPDRFPFQLLLTLALVPWITLLVWQRKWIGEKLRALIENFGSNGLAGGEGQSTKRSSLPLAIALFIVTILFFLYKILDNFDRYQLTADNYPSGFQVNLVMVLVALFFESVFSTLLVASIFAGVINTYQRWAGEIHELNQTLRDFRLSHYVTRLISGYLYWIYFVAIVGVLAVATPIQTFVAYESARLSADSGFQPQLLAILLVGPIIGAIVGYLVIVILRLVFELLIALVHIAQNTRSRNQLT